MTGWFRLERISGGHQDPPVFWFLPVASFAGSELRTSGASPVQGRGKYDLLWPALCNTAQDAIGLLSRSSIGLVMFDLLSTSIPRFSSAELPSSWMVPSMWLCLGLFLPMCISLFHAKLYFPSFSPVSKGLPGFFVLASFMKYFQHLFLLPYILLDVCLRLSLHPDVNVPGYFFLRSESCHFPGFNLSVVYCFNPFTPAGIFNIVVVWK